MSTATTESQQEHPQEAKGHHGHPHLAHHFASLTQQYMSAKTGMWVFLATEILMFGGLFTAYAVYRGTHPEVFFYGYQFLDMKWGAINTVVLLVSSFTMAWGVRAAQLGQTKLLVTLLGLTILGGFGFMGIKAIEYTAKYDHHVWVGTKNAFYTEGGQPKNPDDLEHAVKYARELQHERAGRHAVADAHEPLPHGAVGVGDDVDAGPEHEQVGALADVQSPGPADWPANMPSDHSLIKPASAGPTGLADVYYAEGFAGAPYAAAGFAEAMHEAVTWDDLTERQKGMVSQFFQIYFLMTGLHGLHVLIGLGLIGWIMYRAAGGVFGPTYFTPVDLVGLYWHLVDLIWIFLFPLLYLIH